ncbi:MAG: protein kinase [Betaproteobacteria bacterium]|nr:protein kinase [Betaproteobacteria bacterium]
MSESTTYRNALPLDSMLLEYRLESVLGAGGFGMTYLGWDTHLEKHVAIKEYLPVELAVRALDGSVVPVTTEHEYNYKWGLERFIQEARTLAKFSHPHIVRVNRYFEANSTGYMVMDYERGESLNQMLKRAPRPEEAKLKSILMPLLEGLHAVHEAGFLHRDIKPSNIFLREAGGPVLLDFGAARHAIGGVTKSLTSVLTPGYAPLEQYATDGRQGPWSDLYAFAGVLYRAIVDENPPDAVSRLKGDTVPEKLAAARGWVSDAFLRAVEWALALDEKQRPQSVSEWRRALSGEAPVSARAPAAALTQVAPTQAAPVSPPAQPARTAGRAQAPAEPQPARPRRSLWRWVAVGIAAFVAVAVVNGWNKQREAKERAQQEAARLAAERDAAAGKEAERLAAEHREAERRKTERRAEDQREAMVRGTEKRLAELEAAMRAEEERLGAKVESRAAEGASVPPRRDRPTREREGRPGDLEEQELRKLRRTAEADFRSADANGDGYLTREEVRGRFPFVEREFQRVDADGDGRISGPEFFRMRRWQAQQRQQKRSDR